MDASVPDQRIHPGDDLSQHPPLIRGFWAIVRERWPEFLPYAGLGPCGDLEIRYPLPSELEDAELYISADVDLGETIIAIRGQHTHGGPFGDPCSSDFMFFRSVQWIEELLNRELDQNRPQLGFCQWLYREMDGLEIQDRRKRPGPGA